MKKSAKKVNKSKKKISTKPSAKTPAMKKTITKTANKKVSSGEIYQLPETNKNLVLHVGCGTNHNGSRLHKTFKNDNWQEVRFDIDKDVNPDICADMCNMDMVLDNQFKSIWSSHNIEHLFAHDVPIALGEFHRVLKDGGFVLIACPDIQAVMEGALKVGFEQPLYQSPMGPICPIDIFYGHRGAIEKGSVFMAHKTGYTARTLANKLVQAGFVDVQVKRESGYNLLAIGYKKSDKSKANLTPKIIEEDVIDMMKRRDELDAEPVSWKGLSA